MSKLKTKNKNTKNMKLKDNSKVKSAAHGEAEVIKPKKEIKAKFHEENFKKLPGVQDFWNLEPKRKLQAIKTKEVDDDEEDNGQALKRQKLTGAERFKQFVEEEKRIREKEEELADPNTEPHTPDQFDRLLMKDMNNSFLWIKYMAFHLETADTEKARAVGKKAISQINFREESELLNIWIALLNLEIRYGTDETYQETLTESVQRNEPFKIYTRTITILLEVEKFEEANRIIEILLKKYKPFPEMWLAVCEAYLVMKEYGKCKQLLPKSLLSLKEKDRKKS
jgi:rRNA biogenesis protein RRP5